MAETTPVSHDDVRRALAVYRGWTDGEERQVPDVHLAHDLTCRRLRRVLEADRGARGRGT